MNFIRFSALSSVAMVAVATPVGSYAQTPDDSSVDGDTITGTWTLKELGIGGTWESERTSRDISEEELTEIAGEAASAGTEKLVEQSPGSSGLLQSTTKRVG
jgi:hypothetical protein